MKKEVKLYVIVALIIVIAVTIAVISNNNSNIKTNSNEFKDDIKAITNKFPNLGNIEKCYWKADIIGENSRNSSPAPSSYLGVCETP
jgi:hypothetical protein